MFLGAIGLGAGVQKLPRPVAIGFSTGIAVLVVSVQLPDLLGISTQMEETQDH
jgi:MFS superfamily sulfate permease-like transporter